MNIVNRIINAGTDKHVNQVYNKHIRLTNSIVLFVCIFIIQNLALALYYNNPLLMVVYVLHFILIAAVPVINHLGKRVLATAWFSFVAIIFVTFYAIQFTLDSYNFVFLALLILLQFFIFSASEKAYIAIFTGIIILCWTGAILWQELHIYPLMLIPKELIIAQKWNSLIGIPFLTLAFGIYAFSTIYRAEQDVITEKEKTDQLLLNILPGVVAERFKNDQSFLAEGYQSVSVLFADIVGFTNFSEKAAPDDLVKFLNDVFSKFDILSEEFGLEKIKTIGDSYMVAGGVPTPSNNHLPRICKMALKMQEAIQPLKTPSGQPVQIRIGISTGPVTAGVIGVKKFTYDLWGDTVNTASRMESHAEVGSIQVTNEVYLLIKNVFECKERGVIQVKGKGAMMTYNLTGIK
jgi:adenylate cyclase